MIHDHLKGPGSASSSSSSEACAAKAFRVVTATVCFMGALVTVMTVHSLYPVVDPITPLGILDRLSLWMGVHSQSAVVAIDVALFSTTVYAYVFHRHISDGSFHVASEAKATLLPGVFNAENDTILVDRVEEVIQKAIQLVPKHCFRPKDDPDDNKKPAIVLKISPDALRTASSSEVQSVASNLNRILEASPFRFSPDTSLGTLRASEERVLQWFAINLLRHTLRDFSVARTAAILNVGTRGLEITLAVTSRKKVPQNRLKEVNKLSTFGHLVKLVTLSYPHLGLYEARHSMLMSTVSKEPKEAVHSSHDVHSPCMNPISEASWQWDGDHMRVYGKEEPDYELVKERNGPFAGKKINRPVASYDQCHKLALNYFNSKITPNETILVKDLLKGRPVFMEGLLLEKCMERGLTLPYRGGNVRMKSFVDSLQHACKVPNTDQPFGCIDMMYLATLADKLLGFTHGSVLYSSCDIEGMTGEWPIAAAFHVYENGL